METDLAAQRDTWRAMSQENVEVVRHWIDAGNRADLDRWLSCFAPDAEWHTSGRFADRGVYRGREGLTRYWTEVQEDIEDLITSISEIRAISDKVFVAVTLTGRGQQSKARFEEQAWMVATCSDGLVERVEAYLDPERALEAAGLREQARSQETWTSCGRLGRDQGR
jgi:ketosteroid isomerase-like protein